MLSDDIKIGINDIDYRHERFLDILDRIKKASDNREFLSIFEEMIEDTKEHFSYEEELMDKYEFYDKKEHFDEHQKMLDEMIYFYEKAKKIPQFGKSYVNEYAYEKFKRHIINIDSQLAMFLKNLDIK
jgi:hemerythrin